MYEGCPQRPEDSIRSSGTGVKCCELTVKGGGNCAESSAEAASSLDCWAISPGFQMKIFTSPSRLHLRKCMLVCYLAPTFLFTWTVLRSLMASGHSTLQRDSRESFGTLKSEHPWATEDQVTLLTSWSSLISGVKTTQVKNLAFFIKKLRSFC